jgi:hypothetical protein
MQFDYMVQMTRRLYYNVEVVERLGKLCFRLWHWQNASASYA